IVSLILLMPFTRKLGLLISTSLVATFTFYLAYMIFFTPELPCSCGGILKDLNWTEHLILNIVLLVIAATSWWLSKSNQRFIAINRNSRTPE
ncbi:MAG: MauE/DoxX family redox-associated membrane protein, partial [Lacibacter sp.]